MDEHGAHRSYMRRYPGARCRSRPFAGRLCQSHRPRCRRWPCVIVGQALAGLSAPLGVHAILGNHDYWEDRSFQRGEADVPIALSELLSAGIRTYRNQAIRLEKDGQPFWLAGLDDQLALLPGSRYGRPRMAGLGDLDATLRQVADHAPYYCLPMSPTSSRRCPTE